MSPAAQHVPASNPIPIPISIPIPIQIQIRQVKVPKPPTTFCVRQPPAQCVVVCMDGSLADSLDSGGAVGVATTTDASFVCFDRGCTTHTTHTTHTTRCSVCLRGSAVLALAATDLLAGALNFYFLNLWIVCAPRSKSICGRKCTKWWDRLGSRLVTALLKMTRN